MKKYLKNFSEKARDLGIFFVLMGEGTNSSEKGAFDGRRKG